MDATTPKKIDVREFLGSFTVVYKKTGAGDVLSDWERKALNAIGRLVCVTPEDQLQSDVEKAAVTIQKCVKGRKQRIMQSSANQPGDLERRSSDPHSAPKTSS